MALLCKWWAKFWDCSDRPWKNLCVILPLDKSFSGAANFESFFLSFASLQLGNGRKCKFWLHKWGGDVSIASSFPSLFSFACSPNISVCQALSLEFWIDDLHRPLSPLASAELHLLQTSIASSVSLDPERQDSACWSWNSDGSYTPKSAYEVLCFGRTNYQAPFLWKAVGPLKCKFFMWLATHGSCLTAENLARRGWTHPSSCCLCLSHQEDVVHLFVHCSYTNFLFSTCFSKLGIGLPSPGNSSTVSAWWLTLRCAVPPDLTSAFDSLFILIVWSVWKERNNRIFQNHFCQLDNLWTNIVSEFKLWLISSSSKKRAGLERLLSFLSV